MSDVTNELFAAIEGGAMAALNGEDTPKAELLKKELEKLSEHDVEEMKKVKISPARWAEILISAVTLGKQLRSVIRELRKTP
jgi:hypothetical protein